MDPRKDRLLELMLLHGLSCRSESTFELADGTMSWWFVDCKELGEAGAAQTLVGALLYNTAKLLGVEVLAASGGTAGTFAQAAVTHSAGRSKPLRYVDVGQLAGSGEPIGTGATVAFVDDVLATGVSSTGAIALARSHGLYPTHLIAVIDREEGGAARVQSLGVQVHALTTGTELLARWRAAQRHATEAGLVG